MSIRTELYKERFGTDIADQPLRLNVFLAGGYVELGAVGSSFFEALHYQPPPGVPEEGAAVTPETSQPLSPFPAPSRAQTPSAEASVGFFCRFWGGLLSALRSWDLLNSMAACTLKA